MRNNENYAEWFNCNLLALSLIVFTPCITFGFFPSDLSPFYLLFVLVYYLKNGAMSLYFLTSFFLVSAIALINFFTLNDLLLYKFSCVVLMSQLLFEVSKRVFDSVTIEQVLIIAILWLLLGLITILEEGTFASLLFRVASGQGRGAVGLMSEPSLYGISSAFLYAISYLKERRMRRKGVFSPSTFFLLSVVISVSFYAALILLLILLSQKRFWLIAFAVVFAIFFVFLLDNNIRFFMLLKNLIENKSFEIFLQDNSIFTRLRNLQTLHSCIAGTHANFDDMQTNGIIIICHDFSEHYLWVIWIFLLFYLTCWRRVLYISLKSMFDFLIFLVLFLIGPMSNPFFWLCLGYKNRLVTKALE